MKTRRAPLDLPGRLLWLVPLALLVWMITASPQKAQAQNASPTVVTLLSAGAATGNQLLWPGGGGILKVVGTWNGATLALQDVGPDGTTLLSVGNASFTANGQIFFVLSRGLIQATITGAGGSTSLTAVAYVVPTLLQ